MQESRQRQPLQPAHLQIELPVVRPNMINFHTFISSIEVPLSFLNTDRSLDCGTISASHLLKSISSPKYLLMATNTTRSGSPHKCPAFGLLGL